jgi:hypothetical protein
VNQPHYQLELIHVCVCRSSQIIFQDAENSLVTVTLFERVVDEYKHKVRAMVTIFNVLLKFGCDNFFSQT